MRHVQRLAYGAEVGADVARHDLLDVRHLHAQHRLHALDRIEHAAAADCQESVNGLFPAPAGAVVDHAHRGVLFDLVIGADNLGLALHLKNFLDLIDNPRLDQPLIGDQADSFTAHLFEALRNKSAATRTDFDLAAKFPNEISRYSHILNPPHLHQPDIYLLEPMSTLSNFSDPSGVRSWHTCFTSL